VIVELVGFNRSCHRFEMQHAPAWRIQLIKGKGLGQAVVVSLDDSCRSHPGCREPRKHRPIFNPPALRSLTVFLWWLKSTVGALGSEHGGSRT
jgi:hypothetical protein